DLLILANGTLGNETVDSHLTAARIQFCELVQVDNLVLHTEWVLEAAQLRSAHVQRHLPALETNAHCVAGLRTLRTAAGSLSFRSFAATHTGIRGVGTGNWAQVMHLQHTGAGDRSLLHGGRLLGRRLLR